MKTKTIAVIASILYIFDINNAASKCYRGTACGCQIPFSPAAYMVTSALCPGPSNNPEVWYNGGAACGFAVTKLMKMVCNDLALPGCT
jgi:hypothetical protein